MPLPHPTFPRFVKPESELFDPARTLLDNDEKPFTRRHLPARFLLTVYKTIRYDSYRRPIEIR